MSLERILSDVSPEVAHILDAALSGRELSKQDATVLLGAEGGDLYDAFPEGKHLREYGKVADVVIEYLGSQDVVAVPKRGRQRSASR